MVRKGYKQSEEHKRKRSLALLGRGYYDLHTKEVAEERRNKCKLRMTGNKLSKKTRKKLSESLKGIIPKNINYFIKTGEKTRFEKGQTAWNKGKRYSEETKNKIRLANIGKKQSEETKIKRGIYIGRPISKQEKINLSKLMKERRKGIVVPKIDTSIEVKIQNLLKQSGIQFVTHQYMKDIKYSYQCDIFIPVQEGINQKTIIECDGDYWHGNPEKLDLRKVKRSIKIQRCLDFERTAQLKEAGFRVIRLWGSEIKPMEINNLRSRL